MSIKAMNWAWSQVLPPTSKLILMAIADSANDCGECWMSNATTAQKCCVSERTVQRELAKFALSGMLTIAPRHTPAGRQTSNVYRLNLGADAYPDKLSPSAPPPPSEGDNLSGTGVKPDVRDEGDITVSPPEPPNESSKEPLLQQDSKTASLYFPRGLSVSQRVAIESLVSDVAADHAQALIDELADAMESHAIKTSALRWFAALVRRHKAGEFVALGGVRIAERRQKNEATKKLDDAGTKGEHDIQLARDNMAQITAMLRSAARKTR